MSPHPIAALLIAIAVLAGIVVLNIDHRERRKKLSQAQRDAEDAEWEEDRRLW